MDIDRTDLSTEIRVNVTNLKTLMDDSSDLLLKYAKVGGQEICIVCCEGMTSSEKIANMIFLPLNNIGNEKIIEPNELFKILKDELLVAVEQNQVQTYTDFMSLIMSGYVVILIEGVKYGFAIGVQGYNVRSVEQSTTHLNLRSSREGFNEVIRTNMSMLRRRIKSPTLVFKMLKVGQRSNTDVCVCYLSDKASAELVKSVIKRIENIDINMVLESGYIQPFLQSKHNKIFSEIGSTERPDIIAGKLSEGRVAVLVDGTPFALYLPYLFIENFQTMDDYTGLPVYITIVRFLKYFAFTLTVLLPGLYLALADFHPELFPNSLLFNLLVSEQSTPFPLLIECVIIHMLYEIMYEAGLRLPTYVGHVVSIVGGLVIGQIVVSAGLVGAPIVLIVAISSITGFVVPDITDAIVVLRFAFIFAGGFWGLYGIILLGMIVMIKVFSMSNHGVPYTAPISPFTGKALRDFIVRSGWRKLAKDDIKLQELVGVNPGKIGVDSNKNTNGNKGKV